MLSIVNPGNLVGRYKMNIKSCTEQVVNIVLILNLQFIHNITCLILVLYEMHAI